jgi:integrase
MRREHACPLPRQAVEILEALRSITGRGALVFPGLRTDKRPISENTLNGALRRLGYSKDEATAHGFRATASTMLNECGLWSHDAIERALAHQDPNAVRRAYARGAYSDERVRMAQWRADHLDELRARAADRREALERTRTEGRWRVSWLRLAVPHCPQQGTKAAYGLLNQSEGLWPRS